MTAAVSRYVLLLSLILVYSACRTQSDSTESSDPSASVEEYINKVPFQKMREGLLEYYLNLSKINEVANASIEELNNQFLEDSPCFAELVYRFYTKMIASEIPVSLEKLIRVVRGLEVLEKPSLDEEFGKGLYANLKPGWVWDTALRHAQGNKNIAFWLIGYCGHDDAVMSLANINHLENSPELLKERTSAFEEMLESVNRKWGSFPKDSPEGKSLSVINESMNDLVNAEDHLKQILCPQILFRLPKGLGKDIDISEKFKRRLIEIQAPEEGGKSLPAKYYHVLGSAYVSCKAKQKGLSLFGPTIAWTAAYAYRGMKMCTHLSSVLRTKSSFFEKDTLQETENLWRERISEAVNDRLCLDGRAEGMGICKKIGSAFENYYSFFQRKNVDNDYIEKLVKRTRGKIDAAELWTDWYPRIVIKDVGEFCIPIRSMRRWKVQGGSMDGRNLSNDGFCKSGWSSTRCREALNIMDEWEADFKWTAEQHQVGAKFGSDQCSYLGSFDKIEQQSCSLLGRRN